MKTSCIERIPNDPMVIIRKSYVTICQGDICAAALLYCFEYWHNTKNEKIQAHTKIELKNNLFNTFGRRAITTAIKTLKELNFITTHSNPNPRYKFDSTTYYQLHPENVNQALNMLKEAK